MNQTARRQWTILPHPLRTGYQKYMAWQKANEALKMVNPRNDLWDGLPPYPVAPVLFTPPSLHVVSSKLWITAPGGPETHLDLQLSTNPPAQYVQIGSAPFNKILTKPTLTTWSSDYHLVIVKEEPPATYYSWIGCQGGNGPSFIIHQPPGTTGIQNFAVRPYWNGASAGGTTTNDPLTPWVTFDNATYPASPAGPQDIPFSVDFDYPVTPSQNALMRFQFTGQGYIRFDLVTPTGVLSCASVGTAFRFVVFISFPVYHTYGWEYPRHTVGLPRAGDFLLVRLVPVDIASGSPGSASFVYLVAE